MFWFRLDTSPLPGNYSHCSKSIIRDIQKYDSMKDNLAYNVIPVITIIFSCAAIILNIIFCYLVIFALRNRMLPFRGYSLMLNRAFTDLFVSITTVVFIALHRTREPDTMEQSSTYQLEY